MSNCNSGSSNRPCCVVLDWDDTLYPTTSLGSLESSSVPDQSLQENLCKVLEEALRLAPKGTYIVTNAVEGWVEHCVKNFYPAAMPLLERVQVVSARNLFFKKTAEADERKAMTPEDLCTWKAAALQSLTEDDSGHGLNCKDEGPLNVVAIGDAPTDTKAAKTLVPYLPAGSWLKTVQLMPAPSLSRFAEQLRLILGAMEKVMNHPKSASLCVGPQPEQATTPEHQPSCSQEHSTSSAMANKEVKPKPIQRRRSSYGGCRSVAGSSMPTNTFKVPMAHQ